MIRNLMNSITQKGKEVKMMKKILLITMALLCIAGSAFASPIALPSGPVYFQYNDMEQIDLANQIGVPGHAQYGTANDWGLFNISSLQFGGIATDHQDISGGPTFFSDAGPGHPQVSGIIGGIVKIAPDGTTATGGFVDLYWHDSGTIDAACLAGGCLPTSGSVDQFTTTGGIFLARLLFDSGIITGSNTIFETANFDLGTLGGSGRTDAFLSVDLDPAFRGAWTDALNGNWFFVDTNGDGTFGGPGELRDVRLSSFLNNTLQTTWGGTDAQGGPILGFRSNDPGRVFVIPEPSTLILLSLGLLGLGFSVRRKKE